MFAFRVLHAFYVPAAEINGLNFFTTRNDIWRNFDDRGVLVIDDHACAETLGYCGCGRPQVTRVKDTVGTQLFNREHAPIKIEDFV